MSGQSSGVRSLEKVVYGGNRAEIVALVPPEARRILDVGCAAGDVGEALKQRGQDIEVTGIEMSPSLGAAARPKLDRVIVGIVEESINDLPGSYFDCIICADVLEHMVNPFQVLADIRPKLAPGGVVVSSIPNVRHYRVVRELVLRGRWDYHEIGLLDSGHLRFFTLDAILKMFHWAGYEVEISGVNRIATARALWLNRLLFGKLLPFIDYQYFVTARPIPGFAPSTRPWWAIGAAF